MFSLVRAKISPVFKALIASFTSQDLPWLSQGLREITSAIVFLLLIIIKSKRPLALGRMPQARGLDHLFTQQLLMDDSFDYSNSFLYWDKYSLLPGDAFASAAYGY